MSSARKAGSSSFLHFMDKLLHGLLCDNAPFSTGKRSPGVIERKNERAAGESLFDPR